MTINTAEIRFCPECYVRMYVTITSTPKWVHASTDTVQCATPNAADVRTEYGALTVTKHIYMHDFNIATVQAFIAEFSDCCPITLATRQWVGDTHTAWKEEGK